MHEPMHGPPLPPSLLILDLPEALSFVLPRSKTLILFGLFRAHGAEFADKDPRGILLWRGARTRRLACGFSSSYFPYVHACFMC